MPAQRPIKVIRLADEGRELTIEQSVARTNELIAHMAHCYDDEAEYHAWALMVMRSALRKAAAELTVVDSDDIILS